MLTSTKKPPGAGASRWLLATDDSPTVCCLLRALTQSLDCEVRSLSHVIDLGPLLQDDPPSAVVLDLNRPGQPSGLEVGRVIRQRQRSHIPIVIYSGSPEWELQSVSRELRADSIVRKGASLDQLHLALHRALSGQRPPSRAGVRLMERMLAAGLHPRMP